MSYFHPIVLTLQAFWMGAFITLVFILVMKLFQSCLTLDCIYRIQFASSWCWLSHNWNRYQSNTDKDQFQVFTWMQMTFDAAHLVRIRSTFRINLKSVPISYVKLVPKNEHQTNTRWTTAHWVLVPNGHLWYLFKSIHIGNKNSFLGWGQTVQRNYIVNATLSFSPMTSIFLLNKAEINNVLHNNIVQFDQALAWKGSYSLTNEMKCWYSAN